MNQLSRTLAIITLTVLGGIVLYAAPPTTQYQPAETLDPTCAPGDANCSVSVHTLVPTSSPALVGSVVDSVNFNGAIEVAVSGKYAYMISFGDTLSVFDISEPTNPQLVTYVNDGTLYDDGHDIKIAGNYAFVAARRDDEVTVVDISNPSEPTAVGSVASGALFNNLRKLAISGNYLYVAGQSSHAVSVVDISNPIAPSIVGSVASSTLMDDILTLDVAGDYVYAGSSDADTVTVIDVSNPSNPTIVGSVTDATDLPVVTGLYARGSYVYHSGSGVMNVIDVSDPTDPTIVGSVANANIGGYDIHVVGNYAYVSGSTFVNVIDISDPTDPTLLGSSGNLESTLLGMDIAGGYAYIARSGANDALLVVDLDALESPSARFGTVSTDRLHVADQLDVANTLSVNGGAVVGGRGLASFGPVSAYMSSGTTTALSARSYSTGDIFNLFDGTTEVMTVLDGGNVGVGTSTPAFDLDVYGTFGLTNLAAISASADAVCLTATGEVRVNTGTTDCLVSSRQFKDNIETYDGGLDLISRLRPVTYTYKDDVEGGARIGLIAEEVDTVEPRLVARDADGAPRSVRYAEIVPALIGAVTELENKINKAALGLADSVTQLVMDYIRARRIVASDELCVGGTCVTEAEFRQLLELRATLDDATVDEEEDVEEVEEAEEPAEEEPIEEEVTEEPAEEEGEESAEEVEETEETVEE